MNCGKLSVFHDQAAGGQDGIELLQLENVGPTFSSYFVVSNKNHSKLVKVHSPFELSNSFDILLLY